MPEKILFTEVKSEKIVSKLFFEDEVYNNGFDNEPDRNIRKIGYHLIQGHAKTNCFSFTEFINALKSISEDSTKCIITGINPHSEEYDLVCTSELRHNQFYRRKETFTYDHNDFGILHIDYDYKEGQPYRTPKCFDSIIKEVFPSFKSMRRIYKTSSSYGVKKDGFPLNDTNGYHCYVIVPSRLIKPIADHIYNSLWCSGHGFIYISKVGAPLHRSLLDKAVISPERIIYTAPAQVLPPLTKDDTQYKVLEGDDHLYDGNHREKWARVEKELNNIGLKEAANQAIEKAKELSRPECKIVRENYIQKESVKYIAKGYSKEQARHIVESRCDGILVGDDIVILSNGKHVSVVEILDTPAKYHRETLYDPNEPEEGPGRAILYVNGNSIIISSRLHGGITYRLMIDNGAFMDFKCRNSEEIQPDVNAHKSEEFPERETQVVDFNDIKHTDTTPPKHKPKNAFLKSLDITASLILKDRNPHDFLIEMPEDYQAEIIKRDLQKEGREYIKSNFDFSLNFSDTMSLYETELKGKWNPELSHPWFTEHPKFQLFDKDLIERRQTFQKFIARNKEKRGIQTITPIETDQILNSVHPLEFVRISGGRNSHGYNLKKILIQELQNSREQELNGQQLLVYEYTLECFLGMCFSYPKFIFPMSRDSLELRSRKRKGQNVTFSSRYVENWPMSDQILKTIQYMESRNWLKTVQGPKFKEIHLCGDFLEHYKLLHASQKDFKVQLEVLRLVDNATKKKPLLIEYEDTDATRTWRNTILRYIDKAYRHQIITASFNGNSPTKENFVKPDLYIQFESVGDLDPTETANIKAVNLLPKDDYYFHGDKLQHIRMGITDSLNAFTAMTDTALERIRLLNKTRYKKSPHSPKFASYYSGPQYPDSSLSCTQP